nr:hypothetical protein [Bacilli bacterium]
MGKKFFIFLTKNRQHPDERGTIRTKEGVHFKKSGIRTKGGAFRTKKGGIHTKKGGIRTKGEAFRTKKGGIHTKKGGIRTKGEPICTN